MDTILVASVDSALVAANTYLVATANTLNIADGQLGVISKDENAVAGPGLDTFFDQTDTPRRMTVVQGTPNSNNLSNVNAFKVNDLAYLQSAILELDKIISVHERCYSMGTYDMDLLHTFAGTPVADEALAMSVTLQSEKRDIEYSDKKRDEIPASTAWDGVATNANEFVNGTNAWKINADSRWTTGTRPFVIFGINTGGNGSGTLLSGVSNGSQIPFQVQNGITHSYTVDPTFVNSLALYYAGLAAGDQTLMENWTVEVLDPDTIGAGQRSHGNYTITNNANIGGDSFTIAGTALVEGVDFAAGVDAAASAVALAAAIDAAGLGVYTRIDADAPTVILLFADDPGAAGDAITTTYTDSGSGVAATVSGATLADGGDENINGLLFVGFDESDALAFDDSISRKVRINPATDNNTYTQVDVSQPAEPFGDGRSWRIHWAKRVAPYIHSLQNKDFGNYDFHADFENPKVPCYIDADTHYNSVIIEFYRVENTLTLEAHDQHRVIILMPVEFDEDQIAFDDITFVDGYTFTATNGTMETSFSTVLTGWLQAAYSLAPYEYSSCAAMGLVPPV